MYSKIHQLINEQLCNKAGASFHWKQWLPQFFLNLVLLKILHIVVDVKILVVQWGMILKFCLWAHGYDVNVVKNYLNPHVLLDT